jgi:hypothetical protein
MDALGRCIQQSANLQGGHPALPVKPTTMDQLPTDSRDQYEALDHEAVEVEGQPTLKEVCRPRPTSNYLTTLPTDTPMYLLHYK